MLCVTPARRASWRARGASFMKLGRAPTTDRRRRAETDTYLMAERPDNAEDGERQRHDDGQGLRTPRVEAAPMRDENAVAAVDSELVERRARRQRPLQYLALPQGLTAAHHPHRGRI